MGSLDRIITVLVTATLVSAGWIVAGPMVFADDDGATATADTRDGAPPVAAGDAMPAPENVPEIDEPRPTPLPPGSYAIPVQGVAADELVDTYAQARDGGMRRHDAIDIMAPRGTPVLAATAGTVEKLFDSRKGGLTVYIRGPDDARMHYYAHLDSYADGLAEGQKVAAGEVIGTVGSTGNARDDAPHLHYAVMELAAGDDWWEGTPINPYPLLTEN